MPIKGLSDRKRLIRVGKIHLGIKAQGQRGEYPKAVDYFVVRPDATTPEAAAAAFHEVYGEQPRELDVVFPTDDITQWADPWYRAYSQSWGLICKGNGEEATARWDNAGQGPRPEGVAQGSWASASTKEFQPQKIPCMAEDCPMQQAKPPRCKAVMNLQFLLPNVRGIGVWQCVDDETEILTEQGWARGEDVEADGRVYAWKDGRLRLEPVQAVVRWPEDTYEMVHFQTRLLDSLVTAGHRVVFRPEHRDGWIVKPASDIPARAQFPAAGLVDRPEMLLPLPVRQTCADCGESLQKDQVRWRHGLRRQSRRTSDRRYPVPHRVRDRVQRCNACSLKRRGQRDPLRDDVLRLLAWMITEGTSSNATLEIAQSTKHTEHVAEIEGVLNRLFGRARSRLVPSGKGGAPIITFRLTGSDRAFVLSYLGEAVHTIPAELLNGLSARQLRLLHDTLMKGDGCRGTPARRGYFYPGHNRRLADDFQALSLLLGFRSGVGQGPSGWITSFSPRMSKLGTGRRQGCAVSVQTAPWCVTTPSGTFVARRRGYAFVTGNCDTGSWNSIRNLQDGIGLIQSATGGRIRGLWLKLRLSPKEVTPPDGGTKTKTVWVLDVAMPGVSLEELLAEAAKLPKDRLLAGPELDEEEPPEDLGLPAPEEPGEERVAPEGLDIETGEIERTQGVIVIRPSDSAPNPALDAHLARTPDHDATKCDDCKKYGAMGAEATSANPPGEEATGEPVEPICSCGRGPDVLRGADVHAVDCPAAGGRAASPASTDPLPEQDEWDGMAEGLPGHER